MPAKSLTAYYCKPTSFRQETVVSEMLAHFLPITERENAQTIFHCTFVM